MGRRPPHDDGGGSCILTDSVDEEKGRVPLGVSRTHQDVRESPAELRHFLRIDMDLGMTGLMKANSPASTMRREVS